MSQTRGKLPRDRKRRLSDPSPYKVPAKTAAGMPTTRHSPARASATAAPEPQMSDLIKELAGLRQSIDNKFDESGKKVDNLKTEVLAKLNASDQAIAELQETVTDITLNVARNQRAIHEVRFKVERREVELPLCVKKIVQEALAARPPRITGQKPYPLTRSDEFSLPPTSFEASQENGVKEADYSRARRSLRLWPVSREGDLRDRTVEFLVNELLLDQQHAAELEFQVKRVASSKGRDGGQAVREEVLLTFDTRRTRDEVRSHAKNLEQRGMGLRLEIPDHLWPSFRALQSIGYELKQKHSGMKRNILFDDENADLKLDVCINSQWKTILPAEARTSLKKLGRANMTGHSLSSSELDKDDEVVEMDSQDEF